MCDPFASLKSLQLHLQICQFFLFLRQLPLQVSLRFGRWFFFAFLRIHKLANVSLSIIDAKTAITLAALTILDQSLLLKYFVSSLTLWRIGVDHLYVGCVTESGTSRKGCNRR